MYSWVCPTCGKSADVIRSVTDIEVKPTEEEGGCEHTEQVERVLKGTPAMVKGANWGPGKGYW